MVGTRLNVECAFLVVPLCFAKEAKQMALEEEKQKKEQDEADAAEALKAAEEAKKQKALEDEKKRQEAAAAVAKEEKAAPANPDDSDVEVPLLHRSSYILCEVVSSVCVDYKMFCFPFHSKCAMARY